MVSNRTPHQLKSQWDGSQSWFAQTRKGITGKVKVVHSRHNRDHLRAVVCRRVQAAVFILHPHRRVSYNIIHTSVRATRKKRWPLFSLGWIWKHVFMTTGRRGFRGEREWKRRATCVCAYYTERSRRHVPKTAVFVLYLVRGKSIYTW